MPPCLPVHYTVISGVANPSVSGRREKSFWVEIAGGPAAAIGASLFSGSRAVSKGNFRLVFRRLKLPL